MRRSAAPLLRQLSTLNPKLFLVDAFTRERGAGNPAHIALCGLEPPAAMRRALTETLAAGDVGFVYPVAQEHGDLGLCFETPRGPAPFVAHVTLAAHALRAHLGLPPAPRQWQGAQMIRVQQRAGGVAPEFAIGQTPAAQQRALGAEELPQLLAALGLATRELDTGCPAAIAGGASRRLLLGVDSPATLARLRPDREGLLAQSRALEVSGLFVFARTPGHAQHDTEARMFAPALGIGEDPVSGNAYGMLACHLWRHGLLPDRVSSADGASAPPAPALAVLRGAQGAALGRPGNVRIELSCAAGAVQAMQIVGNAIVNSELAWPAGVTA